MKQYKSLFKEEKIPDGFDKFLNKVKELTKHNNHGEARLEIAKFFKFKKYMSIFEAINNIHNIDDGNVHNLLIYRDDVEKQMLDLIKRHYGNDVYNKVKSGL